MRGTTWHKNSRLTAFTNHSRTTLSSRTFGYMRTGLLQSMVLQSIIIFSLLTQQGAFIEMPALTKLYVQSDVYDINPLNTIAVALSAALLFIPLLLSLKRLGYLAKQNLAFTGYLLLALASVLWSVSPDLTIRRSLGYILSMSFAAYLVSNFKDAERMKLLSASFAVSGIASMIYIMAAPDDGIMQISELYGNWRGVFPHKNVLGPVMAVAVFVELYVINISKTLHPWHLFLLGIYLTLIWFSRSVTGLLMSTCFLAFNFVYLLWLRNQLAAIIAALYIGLTVFMILLVVWSAPDITLGLLGKNTSFTGRTDLWPAVVELIKQKPILGYGFRSIWASTDSYAILNGVIGSQNTFLEIFLQLGAFGIGLLVAIVAIAFWRGIRCCLNGINPLGWFSLVYFFTIVAAGQGEQTMGQEQNVFWFVFSVLFLGCGANLWRARESSGGKLD